MSLSRSALLVVTSLAVGLGWGGCTETTPPTAQTRAESSAPAPSPAAAPLSAAASQAPPTRHIRYQFTVHNTRAQLREGAVVEVFAPLAHTASQRTLALAASQPYSLQEDAWGNRTLQFALRPLAPYASRVIRIEAELALGGASPQPESPPQLARYLGPAPGIESDDPAIRALAEQLRGQHPLGSLHNIQQWVATHIHHDAYLRESRGARYALDTRRGDCTEQAALAAALARALGLPARILAGYADPTTPSLRPEDYHNWAEVWTDERWVRLDPDKKRFDHQADGYLALRIVGRGANAEPGLVQRFAVQGDGLRVAMN
jgi:transglutaminase-like putative cysteine protease